MKVITNVTNDLFIKLQYLSLKKFLKNDFEFIVFNDAKAFHDYTNDGNNDNHKQITCPAIRCAMSMNEMHKYYLSNPDKYLIIDSDMFLIDYFDINKYENYKSAILL